MRNAINSSNLHIGNSASIRSAKAIVAARDAHTYLEHGWKPLSKVEVPVVSVRGSLCERRADTKQTSMEQPTGMWQRSSFEMPAAAWATVVLNRTASV